MRKLQATKSWAGPGNEANGKLYVIKTGAREGLAELPFLNF